MTAEQAAEIVNKSKGYRCEPSGLPPMRWWILYPTDHSDRHYLTNGELVWFAKGLEAKK